MSCTLPVGNRPEIPLKMAIRVLPPGSVVSKPQSSSNLSTGIGDWSPSELVDYLSEGLLPDGDYAGSLMADVIDNGLAYLTPEDVQAIVEYIITLPAIAHSVDDGNGDEDSGG